MALKILKIDSTQISILDDSECPNIVELFIADSGIRNMNLRNKKLLQTLSFGFDQTFSVKP